MKSLLKPKRDKSINQRNSFGVLNHSNSMADAFRGSCSNGRFFTETMPCRPTYKENIGQVKKVGNIGKKGKTGQKSTANFGK
jgi:hypothetical protein